MSGGGTTTTFSALLDDRIAVIGPSCCVTPLADLDISQCYAGCPETHQLRRYALGVDEVDLLCAAAPKPCLLMAGEFDEVFHIGDTRKLAEAVAGSYARMGHADRFRFFVDKNGHGYSLAQAHEFVRFMNSHLLNAPDRSVTDVNLGDYPLIPFDQVRCFPRADVNMRTLAIAEADALAAGWKRDPESIRHAAETVAGVSGWVMSPAAEVGDAFQVWTHDWRSVLLQPEPGIELPATLLTARQPALARANLPAATILHFDDDGRHRLLHQHGLLTEAMRFIERDQPVYNLLTIDLRGWGDTAPTMYPYEMPWWGSVDRYLAYGTAALGDPIMGMRIHDALRALAWLRTRPEVNPAQIVITGAGLGSIVALHVAAIDRGRLAGVVGWGGLSSFRSLIAAKRYPWPAEAFLPNALRYYDLPELAATASCPVRLLGLRDGTGAPAGDDEVSRYRAAAQVEVTPQADDTLIVASIHALLAGK